MVAKALYLNVRKLYYMIFWIYIKNKKYLIMRVAQVRNGVSYTAHVTTLLCELHWLLACFRYNLRYWLSPLKSYVAWDQITILFQEFLPVQSNSTD